MNQLPPQFLAKMKTLLGPEFAGFYETYIDQPFKALRVNTLKISAGELADIVPFTLEPVGWAPQSYYYTENDQPGKHPYHMAGLYYIQEPSAMAVANVLGTMPGDRVLDLCAAPGGKSTQTAAMLQGEGILVANEIHPGRVKILAENLERFGVRNAVVTNEEPQRLADRFPVFFDRILVDAPCSGEGMFRKDPVACQEWSPENVLMCAGRQKSILNQAAIMLKPGGYMVYSTCTFAPEENEGVIAEFLEQHSDFNLQDIAGIPGSSPGRPEWASGRADLTRCVRLWPHKISGEGHFIALLRRNEDNYSLSEGTKRETNSRKNRDTVKEQENFNDYYAFAQENLKITPKGKFTLYGDNLYLVPEKLPELNGLRVIRPGWHLGVFRKNRFEPAHALAMALAKDQFKNVINFKSDNKEIKAFLQGETLNIEVPKGWVSITVDGYPLGWGKSDGQRIKNHFPKGLRIYNMK